MQLKLKKKNYIYYKIRKNMPYKLLMYFRNALKLISGLLINESFWNNNQSGFHLTAFVKIFLHILLRYNITCEILSKWVKFHEIEKAIPSVLFVHQFLTELSRTGRQFLLVYC